MGGIVLMRIAVSIVLITVAILIVTAFGGIFGTVFAIEEIDYIDRNATNDLIELREAGRSRIDEYEDRFGSRAYGWTFFVLRQIQWFSIPICFLGIAVGAIAQYAIGTRRLDMRHKGSRMMYAFGTLLVIAQTMPLIFALVVRGWAS